MCWIPRGAAREAPIRYELSEEELNMVMKTAGEEEDELGVEGYEKSVRVNNEDIEQQGPLDAEEEEEEEDATPMADLEAVDISELPAALNMENYDDSEDEDDDAGMDLEGEGDNDEGEDENDDVAVAHVGGRMYAVDAPRGATTRAEDDDEDDGYDTEDEQDNQILPTDNVLVTAVSTKDEQSELQVWILTGKDENGEGGEFYLHHDVLLPDIPICLAWMDIPPFRNPGEDAQSGIGSYLAVGTFSPSIEIWNLDVIDPLEPTAVLGGEDTSSKAGKKKSKKNRVSMKPGSHTASVMGLSWNTQYRQALASSSADHTVKVWDVTSQACLNTFKHHKDKVQSVKWHPTSAAVLASGSYDHTVCLVDCLATPNAAGNHVTASWDLTRLVDMVTGELVSSVSTKDRDIESLQWNPFNDNELFVSFENGYVACIDRRVNGTMKYGFQAHPKTVSSLSFSKDTPGMLSTASVDKTVKVWDLYTANASTRTPPTCVAYKSMGVGHLLASDYSYVSKDVPLDESTGRPHQTAGSFLMAAGGDANDGAPAVWYSDELPEITEHFCSPQRKDMVALRMQAELLEMEAASTAATVAGAVEDTSAGPKKKNKSKKNSNKTSK